MALMQEWARKPMQQCKTCPVQADALLVVLEAMKMEHELRAPCAVRVSALLREPGDLVAE